MKARLFSKLLSARIALILLFAGPAAFAVSSQVGTLTQVQGDVSIYAHPSKSPQAENSGPGNQALFEGTYYMVKAAQVGDRLEQGNFLVTKPGAMARVVYDNGDQYNVGPGTYFRVNWKQDTATAGKAQPELDLKYGRIRAIITKGGPRSHLNVRTRSAVMGVRGTDFYITSGVDGAPDSAMEVSTLRGLVVVRTTAASKPKEIKVGQGESGYVGPDLSVKPSEEGANAPALPIVAKLTRTTQEDIREIQRTTEIAQVDKDELNRLPANVAEEVQKLETHSAQAVLQDVKTADPKLYAQLDPAHIRSAQQINEASLQMVLKTAPKAPPRTKPTKGELENMASPYDKYFHSDD